MVVESQLRKVSKYATDVLDAMFRAHDAADDYTNTQHIKYAKEFIKLLYHIEDTANHWECSPEWTNKTVKLLARINHSPVILMDNRPAYSSSHQAFLGSALEVCGVAFDIVKAGLPDYYKPGIEYLCPPLVVESDILPVINVAIDSFRKNMPSRDVLNTVGARLEQESARAVVAIAADGDADKSDTKAATPKKISTPTDQTAEFITFIKRKLNGRSINRGELRDFASEFKADNPDCLTESESLERAARRYKDHWKADT